MYCKSKDISIEQLTTACANLATFSTICSHLLDRAMSDQELEDLLSCRIQVSKDVDSRRRDERNLGSDLLKDFLVAMKKYQRGKLARV